MSENISQRRYGLEALTEALKAARISLGISQRELSARSGVPQAKISRIENGGVDLYLSTLIELARALDLDLRLVPRTAIPAVAAAVRETAERANERDLNRTLQRLRMLADKVEHTYPSVGDMAVVRDYVQAIDIQAGHLNPPMVASALAKSVSLLEGLVSGPSRKTPARVKGDLIAAVDRLREVRNIAVHAQSFKQVPAYTLDDEDA